MTGNRFVTMALVLVLVTGLATPTVFGQVRFSAEGLFGLHFGDTQYRYNGPGIGSELIFPLDMTVGGLRGEMTRLRDNLPLWSLRGEITVGLRDPGNPFTDRDWYAIPPGLEANFSYTESDVTSSYLRLDLEGAYLLHRQGGITLSLIGGVGYTKISQEAQGFVGAVLVSIDDTLLQYQPITSGRRALTYDITYITPRIGLRSRYDFSPGVTLELTAAGSPLVYVDDRDEHLLRFFTLEADGRGYGFFGRGFLEFRPGSGETPGRAFIRLAGELTRIGADLSSGISWYGDDPIDEDDNTGQATFGIPHDIRSTQYRISLHVGMAF